MHLDTIVSGCIVKDMDLQTKNDLSSVTERMIQIQFSPFNGSLIFNPQLQNQAWSVVQPSKLSKYGHLTKVNQGSSYLFLYNFYFNTV
jgi:hypothetical protein